uniref:SREBP regulating gene protein n=1 Tax=Brassica campestris TaxID=3711 RepID=M4CGP1_BRACM
MSTSGFSLFLGLLQLVGFLLPLRTYAIRKDIGFLEERICRTTVQGRYLISDDEGTYRTVFDFCAGRCRHSSESVVHENAYHSKFHHCFSLTSNASGANLTQVETRLLGIDVIVGSMQRYMTCKGSCLASAGADQPAEVADDAPRDLVFHFCIFSNGAL